jgi:hypothetical protein
MHNVMSEVGIVDEPLIERICKEEYVIKIMYFTVALFVWSV